MKKIFVLIGVFAMLAIIGLTTKPADAAKEKCTTIQSGELIASDGSEITTGYDKWGYNYQANMFNGWYDNYGRPTAPVTEGDSLMMKWNNAWLSNQDCNEDTKLDRHYGFDSYIDSGAWLTNHAKGTYQSSMANVTGDWLLDFAGGTANREFRNLVQDDTGNVVGEFWWLNSTVWEYGGTLVGNVSGNTLTLHYDRSPAYTYTGDFVGTIGESDITGGIFDDSHGNHLTWTATGPEAYEMCSWSDFVKIVAVPSDAYPGGSVSECPAIYGLDGPKWFTADGEEIGCSIWGSFAVIQDVYSDPCGEMDYAQSYHSPFKSGLGNW